MTPKLKLQKIKNGNEASLEKFVHKYYPMILKYCRYHAMDKHSAEDLTQETFVRFFSSLSRYQHKGKTANYLYVIAGNLCKDFNRRHTEILPENLTDIGENVMESVEDKLSIEQDLSELPEEFREVIILHYFQNLKLKEVADVLQIGLPLVKYRLSKAKEFMRNFLGEEDV